MYTWQDARFQAYFKFMCKTMGWVFKERGKIVSYNVPTQEAYDSMEDNFKAMSDAEKEGYLYMN